jgi:hypothetical protein
MDTSLRNGLLDLIQRRLNQELGRWQDFGILLPHSLTQRFWVEFEKRTTQQLAREGPQGFSAHLAGAFSARHWNKIYDIVQWFRDVEDYDRFDAEINKVLERENAGYRLVNGQINPITSTLEVAEVESAAVGSASSADHLRRAVERLNASTPDFRNAIKEAVQAVEAEVRILAGKPKATLGDALKACGEGMLHPALRKAAEGFWGYSSDDGGIRHAKGEGDTDPTRDEARFCVVTCSALVNLLRAQRITP